MPGPGPGVWRIEDPRGEEARAPCDALLAPGARAARGLWPSKPITGTRMTPPYLDQPLVPLRVALPQMLENFETELAKESLQAGKRQYLRQRAELIRSLLIGTIT